ncbi:MAG: mechanosensitive ion channel [Chloroflexota bacterium]
MRGGLRRPGVLVRDYLNGALILLENQFSKGDVITIMSVSSTVEDFSLRRTTAATSTASSARCPARSRSPRTGRGPGRASTRT